MKTKYIIPIVLISLMMAGGASAADFPSDEAGISAYTDVGGAIDIEKAKTVFRTVECECANYTIGSVELPRYPETDDVHVYVSKSGWILAYYLKDEPVAKIIDWNDYHGGTINGTKLEDSLVKMCDGIGVALMDVKYYDFRYPNANRLMIVADAQYGGGTDTFDIKILSDFTVYERSWSHYTNNYASDIKIDGNTIHSFSGRGTAYGRITPNQLKPDVFHTVSLYLYYDYAFVGIVLVYKE